MNEIINKVLLEGDKFMQEIFTYSACGPFTKNKERTKKIYANWKYRFYLSK